MEARGVRKAKAVVTTVRRRDGRRVPMCMAVAGRRGRHADARRRLSGDVDGRDRARTWLFVV